MDIFRTYFGPPLRMCSRLCLGTPISKTTSWELLPSPKSPGTTSLRKDSAGGQAPPPPSRMDAPLGHAPWALPAQPPDSQSTPKVLSPATHAPAPSGVHCGGLCEYSQGYTKSHRPWRPRSLNSGMGAKPLFSNHHGKSYAFRTPKSNSFAALSGIASRAGFGTIFEQFYLSLPTTGPP